MLVPAIALPLLGLLTLNPSPALASAVNMAICDAEQKWYQTTGKTQGMLQHYSEALVSLLIIDTIIGFCDIGASGGRNQFLYATSGPITVPSLQSGQHAEYQQFGPGVTCTLDSDNKKVRHVTLTDPLVPPTRRIGLPPVLLNTELMRFQENVLGFPGGPVAVRILKFYMPERVAQLTDKLDKRLA